MNIQIAASVLVLGASISGLGCMASDEPQTDEVEQLVGCGSWTCGANSPIINNFGFHDSHEGWLPNLAGLENQAGLKIVRFTKAGTSYRLDVRDGRLYGYQGIVLALSGQALVDARIVMQHAGSGSHFAIRIASVQSNVNYWAAPQAQPAPTLESYRLEWNFSDALGNTTTSRWTNVCSRASEVPADNTPPVDMPGFVAMSGYNTLLFEGDRVDAGHKMFLSALDSKWFNFGCAGSALAKMALMGHTQAARSAGYDTTIPERTTLLKMFVADYCGTGAVWTVAGQPLSWKDNRGFIDHAPNATIEARWTAQGASCLQKIRIDSNPIQLATDTYGMGPHMPSCLTPIPTCANTNPWDTAGTHLVSANLP